MRNPIRVVLTDDDGNVTRDAPKNDRFMLVTIRDIRRKRTVQGTCSLARWANILERIRKRWPRAVISPKTKRPITIRTHRGGPLVLICEALEGPVASVATHH